MSRRGYARRPFYCPKNGKEVKIYGTQNHTESADENHMLIYKFRSRFY